MAQTELALDRGACDQRMTAAPAWRWHVVAACAKRSAQARPSRKNEVPMYPNVELHIGGAWRGASVRLKGVAVPGAVRVAGGAL